MKKVVCVNEKEQSSVDKPKVLKGRTYTVIDTVYEKKQISGGIIHPAGTYYVLLEMPPDIGYHASLFIDLIEDQQDETEFNRNYKTEQI